MPDTQQPIARRSRVDQLIQHVVAQSNVTMMNKSKATFRLPTVRYVSGTFFPPS